MKNKNFLATYNNTHKFPYINNHSFVLEANGECLRYVTGRIKFSTVTQMSMRNLKSYKSRHFSTSVCCKARVEDIWPSGLITFMISAVLGTQYGSLLEVLNVKLANYQNTRFRLHFTVVRLHVNMGIGVMAATNVNCHGYFTFNTYGVLNLVQVINKALEQVNFKPEELSIVMNFLPISNDGSSGGSSSGGPSCAGSLISKPEVVGLEINDSYLSRGRQSINVPNLGPVQCPSLYPDSSIGNLCESSFLSLLRSLLNILFPLSLVTPTGFYNWNKLPKNCIKLHRPGILIRPRNIIAWSNAHLHGDTFYRGIIAVKSLTPHTQPYLEKSFDHSRRVGGLHLYNIIHETVLLAGKIIQDVFICLYLWPDSSKRLPVVKAKAKDIENHNIIERGCYVTNRPLSTVRSRYFSTSIRRSYCTFFFPRKKSKVNKREIVKSFKAYNDNPYISIIISKAQTNKKNMDCSYKVTNNNTHKFLYINNTFSAINKIPKPNLFASIALKSEFSGIKHLYNSSTDLLNVFNARLKKNKTEIVKSETNYNYIGKPRHYPPANKEWFSSIYVYNNKTIKLLPTRDKVTLKLVKSYFNFYSRKLEKKIKSRRLRIIDRRLSTNRILTSRPELKHTNDKVVVTIYVYNRQKIFYYNKIFGLYTRNNILPNRIKIKIIKKKSLKIKSRVKKQKKLAWKTLDLSFSKINNNNKLDNNKFKKYETSYLKHYVLKSLRREMFSVYFSQLISFNESKFENKYLLPLTSLVNKVYNKEVEFNLVNLKHLYLNSYIFSETLVTKLRNRKNRLLRVLKTSLLRFKLPSVDRLALYEQIYNRKRKLQNLKVDNTTANFISSKSEIKSQFNDLLEGSLLNADPNDSISKLKDFKSYWPDSMYYSYPLFLLNTILKSIKNKSVSGLRLEVAGRLTRRNKAARSLFKVRYVGNIRNMDSSFKGLPTVLLRGYAKANLQYTKLKSRLRIGSYGLKGWVSSS